MITREILNNGTRIKVSGSEVRTTLPNGNVVVAKPEARSPTVAKMLGYGYDVRGLTRDHDTLHSRLCDWLGMPYSFSLMQTSGENVPEDLANLEEDAVLAIQRFKVAWERFEGKRR